MQKVLCVVSFIVMVCCFAEVSHAQPDPVAEFTCQPLIPTVWITWEYAPTATTGMTVEISSNEPGVVNPVAVVAYPLGWASIDLPVTHPASIEYTAVVHEASGASTGQVCVVNTAPPANDSCVNATSLGVGEVTAPWSTLFATTGGLPIVAPHSAACSHWSNGDFHNDVWFEFVASTAEMSITLCGGLTPGPHVDVKLALYSGCPGDPATQLVACDDDACDGILPAVHPHLVPGDTYWVRIGASVTTTYGEGTLSIFERQFPPGSFQRGDCNHDGSVNLSDAIFLLWYLHPNNAQVPEPGCFDACDSNDDGGLNIADAIATLVRLFPVSCAPACPAHVPLPVTCADGGDPTPDNFTCSGYIGC